MERNSSSLKKKSVVLTASECLCWSEQTEFHTEYLDVTLGSSLIKWTLNMCTIMLLSLIYSTQNVVHQGILIEQIPSSKIIVKTVILLQSDCVFLSKGLLLCCKKWLNRPDFMVIVKSLALCEKTCYFKHYLTSVSLFSRHMFWDWVQLLCMQI